MSVNTIDCIICYSEYDTELRKPCIGTCGHSICEGCKHQMVSSKCPQCNREEAFAVTTINQQVLEFIKHFKRMQAGTSSTKSLLSDHKGLEEGKCSECALLSIKLRVCTTCTVKAGVVRYDEIKKAFVLNVENDDDETALQNAKKIAICGNCALDGMQHEGHKTQPLAILKNGLEERCPITVEDKVRKLHDNACDICQSLNKKFTETIASLIRYFEQHSSLVADIEKKMHLNNIEASVEKVNDTMSLINDAMTRLEMLKNEFCVSADMVKHNSKAVNKAITTFLNMDPALFTAKLFLKMRDSWLSLATFGRKSQMNIKRHDDDKVAIRRDCELYGVQHDGHKLQPLEIWKNGSEEQIPTTVFENLFKKLQENAIGISQNFNKKVTETITSLIRYFEQHVSLSAAADKKIHFKSIEASLEKFNDTIKLVNDAQTRLDMLNNEFCESADMVKHNSKAVNKASTAFPNMDPVLVADRKINAPHQNALCEPLFICLFNPMNNILTAVGSMPNPKSNYAASNKSQIYIIGGKNNGAWLRDVEMYDEEKKLRRNCNPMKRGRERALAGFHNNKLYVAGGYDGTYMNSVEIFDPDHGDWKEGPPLQRSRVDAAVVSCNGELYVLGGFNGKEYEEKIEKLSDTMQKFEVIGDMHGSRAGFAACAFRGRIYIAGGWSYLNTLRSVRSYDPMTKTWREEPSLNKERKYFTLHSTSKSIYAIRGCDDSWSLINEVEKFDPEGQKWDIISCSKPIQTVTPTLATTKQNVA